MGYIISCNHCGSEFFPQWWRKNDRNRCPACFSDEGELTKLSQEELMDILIKTSGNKLRGG